MEWLVRVTADKPFLHGRFVDLLVDARDSSECAKQSDMLRLHGGLLVEGEYGYKPAPRLPIGFGVELLRSDALAVDAREIHEDEPHHRVHVTSWLVANAKDHAVPTPLEWPGETHWRWTIGTYEDLAMARSAFHLFGEEALTIDYPSEATIHRVIGEGGEPEMMLVRKRDAGVRSIDTARAYGNDGQLTGETLREVPSNEGSRVIAKLASKCFK